MSRDYDEDHELTRYVWDYFASLMTAFEREAGLAILHRTKLSINGPRPSEKMNRIVDN